MAVSTSKTNSDANVSFEFFPAKDEASLAALVKTGQDLAKLNPAFQTVTFSAGGGGTTGARQTSESLEALEKNGVPSASHLAYAGENLGDLHAYTDALAWNGCKHIVALRGDSPELEGGPAYQSVAEMVADLKARNQFEVGVACYPEVHPKAVDAAADLAVLRAKQDAGADYAITQFFFDNDTYFKFVDNARAAGITIPLIPGIMPIHSIEGLKRFASRCGSIIPDFVVDAFENNNWQNPHDIAAGLVRDQVTELAENGVSDLHIYTLNRAPLPTIAAEAFLEARIAVSLDTDKRKVA